MWSFKPSGSEEDLLYNFMDKLQGVYSQHVIFVLLTNWPNKLECLTLATLSSLVL
jgi:hypothetical protein